MTATISTLIIEDELKAAEGLQAQLLRVAPQVNVQGHARTIDTAQRLIQEVQPDLVFLDIELLDGTGFELLQRFDPPNFAVIFVTAYDQYALKAFRVAALDYLLKPIYPADLKAAVQRYQERGPQAALQSLHHWMQQEALNNREKMLSVPEVKGIRYVPTHEVIRVEAESNYSRIFLQSGNELLSTRGLKSYATSLQPFGFFRCHKSFLINLKEVRRFIRGKKAQVEMSDGSLIAVARNLREELLLQLEDLVI